VTIGCRERKREREGVRVTGDLAHLKYSGRVEK
jgi:hypothetical protein